MYQIFRISTHLEESDKNFEKAPDFYRRFAGKIILWNKLPKFFDVQCYSVFDDGKFSLKRRVQI
eukprot:UN18619